MVRESLNMSQSELGEKCGNSKQTIYKYEQGIITNIPMDKLESIADALSVSPAYLLGWEDVQKIDTITKLLKTASPEKLAEIEQFIRFALRDQK